MDITDKFNDDERIFINKALEYKMLTTFTKAEMLADLILYQSATTIDEYVETYSSAIKKIRNLTEEEWEYLKKRYPLWVSFDYENIDEEEDFSFDE